MLSLCAPSRLSEYPALALQHDTYADRMNILSVVYDIPLPPHSPPSVSSASVSVSPERASCTISVVTLMSITVGCGGSTCGTFHSSASAFCCRFWCTASPSEPVSNPSAPWSTADRRELSTARSELAYTDERGRLCGYGAARQEGGGRGL